jgi:hypothetical protein
LATTEEECFNEDDQRSCHPGKRILISIGKEKIAGFSSSNYSSNVLVSCSLGNNVSTKIGLPESFWGKNQNHKRWDKALVAFQE